MGSTRRSRKRLVDVIALVAILVLGAFGANWWFWPSIPSVSADEVESIEVDLIPKINRDAPDPRMLVASTVGLAGAPGGAGPVLAACALLPGRTMEMAWIQERAKIAITDPALIQRLLDCIRAAKRAREHKCPHTGTITISEKGGSFETLSILPGHDSACYEYRYGTRINRVNREQFLAALRAMGVRKIQEAPP